MVNALFLRSLLESLCCGWCNDLWRPTSVLPPHTLGAYANGLPLQLLESHGRRFLQRLDQDVFPHFTFFRKGGECSALRGAIPRRLSAIQEPTLARTPGTTCLGPIVKTPAAPSAATTANVVCGWHLIGQMGLPVKEGTPTGCFTNQCPRTHQPLRLVSVDTALSSVRFLDFSGHGQHKAIVREALQWVSKNTSLLAPAMGPRERVPATTVTTA